MEDVEDDFYNGLVSAIMSTNPQESIVDTESTGDHNWKLTCVQVAQGYLRGEGPARFDDVPLSFRKPLIYTAAAFGILAAFFLNYGLSLHCSKWISTRIPKRVESICNPKPRSQLLDVLQRRLSVDTLVLVACVISYLVLNLLIMALVHHTLGYFREVITDGIWSPDGNTFPLTYSALYGVAGEIILLAWGFLLAWGYHLRFRVWSPESTCRTGPSQSKDSELGMQTEKTEEKGSGHEEV